MAPGGIRASTNGVNKLRVVGEAIFQWILRSFPTAPPSPSLPLWGPALPRIPVSQGLCSPYRGPGHICCDRISSSAPATIPDGDTGEPAAAHVLRTRGGESASGHPPPSVRPSGRSCANEPRAPRAPLHRPPPPDSVATQRIVSIATDKKVNEKRHTGETGRVVRNASLTQI